MAQTTSELWKTLWQAKGTRKEYGFDINGVWYGPEAEVEHSVDSGLYEEFGIGNATTAQLSISLHADDIPYGATIKRYIRLQKGDQVSEWLPKGVFFANRRAEDDGYWTIEAYDSMRKAEAVWEPDQSLEFPLSMPDAVAEFARIIGVEVDPRTSLNPAYTIDYPANDYTIRNELCYIAAAHGGNFIITDAGKLLLIPLVSIPGETNYLVTESGAAITFGGVKIITSAAAQQTNSASDKSFVGLDITGFENNGKKRPISRVTLLVDNDNAITAGDDTGIEISADCPHATQEMVDNILAAVKGYEYQMYSADDANIDPAAELGDGVTVSGIYSVVAQIDDDGSGYAGISAPGEEELEDECPAAGPMTQEFSRQLAQVRSQITKTADQIRLEVANETEELSSSIDVQLSNIRQEIDGKLDGDLAQSLINQALDSITLSVSSSGGSTTFKLTSDGVDISTTTLNLSVAAANITGKLSASQIETSELIVGENIQMGDNATISWSKVTGTPTIPSKTSQLTNDSGYTTPSQVTTITSNTIITASISASQIKTGTLDAGSLKMKGLLAAYYGTSIYGYLGASEAGDLPGVVLCDATENNYVIAATSGVRMSYQDTHKIWVTSNGCWSSSAMKVYSDRRRKNSISYDMAKYERFFNGLKPAFFKLNAEGEDAKYRLGFVAQDVRGAALDSGLAEEDIALLAQTEDGYYGLSYGEFTALNTWKIQRLERRVAELERRLSQ